MKWGRVGKKGVGGRPKKEALPAHAYFFQMAGSYLFEGSSGKCVLFIKPIRPLFNWAGLGVQPPDSLSLWERARARELL